MAHPESKATKVIPGILALKASVVLRVRWDRAENAATSGLKVNVVNVG